MRFVLGWADLVRFPAWAVAQLLYAIAPPRAFFRAADLAGSIEWRLAPGRDGIRPKIVAHLPAGSTRQEVDAVTRRYLQFRRRERFASIWPQLRSFNPSEGVEIEGLQHLDRALSSGAGVILVTAHFGYSQLIKPTLRSRGIGAMLVGPAVSSLGGVALPRPLGALTSFMQFRLWRTGPWHGHPPGFSSESKFNRGWQETVGADLVTGLNLREPLRVLSRNRPLIVLADGSSAQVTLPIPVLGIDVPLASGVFSLARGRDVPLLPAFMVDEPDRAGAVGLKLIIGPPLEVRRTANAHADLKANAATFAAAYESLARRYPHNVHWTRVRDHSFARLEFGRQ